MFKYSEYHFLTLFLPLTLSFLIGFGLFASTLAFFRALFASDFFLDLYFLLFLLIQSRPCIFSLILYSFYVKNLLTFNICLSDLYI